MKRQVTGQWAVITGASNGIGFELAKQFAMNGFDLLVVADDPGVAEAARVFSKYGVEVESLQVDLAEHGGVEKLYRRIQQEPRSLDVLTMNTGLGISGAPFNSTDLDKDLNLISLNIMSVVHLTKYVLKDMLEVGHGRILFTSGLADFMPGPFDSVYAASKAFVQSFANGLRQETKDKDITIKCLQPESKKVHPAEVARIGFENLMDKNNVVVNIINKEMTHYLSL